MHVKISKTSCNCLQPSSDAMLNVSSMQYRWAHDRAVEDRVVSNGVSSSQAVAK